MDKNLSQDGNQKISQDLLILVGKLADELHPTSQLYDQITLNSRLDRDLGFDSLGRVELIRRIEQFYGVSLPEHTFSTAEIIGDLLKVLLNSRGDKQIFDHSHSVLENLSEVVRDRPDNENTLVDVLQWHLQRHPERTHIEIYRDSGRGQQITYGQLAAMSYRVAWGLMDKQLTRSARVTLMLPSSPEYFYSFMGVLAAGAIPVPIYPPMRLSQIESYIRRHQTILKNCQAEVMITTPEVKRFATLLKSLVPSLRRVVTVTEFSGFSDKPLKLAISPKDIAFIQYTSGSTADPKGVQLSHANLLANIRAMGKATRLQSKDIFVSWLPLYHDMGLIGAWLGTFYHSAHLILMSPLEFLARPQRWLWAIHRYQATISAAPNFAYDLCYHRIPDEDLKGLDLSRWRLACNGAEPVLPNTIRLFCKRFSRYHFKREAYWPVYGLAESSVGLAFPRPDRTPHIQKVQRASFMSHGVAKEAATSEPHPLEFVACGEALSGHQIRVVDDMDIELPDRQQGHLQFKGPSSTSGYFRNPEQSAELFHGEWLDTGDLAYLDQGQLYLTGRTKDIIIRAGRNIYPHEIEDAVGEIDGIRRGRVVVFGYQIESREKLIVLAETRETSTQKLQDIRSQILDVCAEIVDLPPDDIVFAPPNTILKTSSGKLRRSACRELYLKGKVGQKPTSLWWQFAKVAMSSINQQLKIQLRNFGAIAFAAYSWLSYILAATICCPLILLLPSLRARRSLARKLCRILAWVTATPINVCGVEKLLADQSYVLVANHTSYLDVYIMVFAIEIPFKFIAKAELTNNFLLALLLKRFDVEFVERFDREKSVADVSDINKDNVSLLFFPEGTFTRQAGLAAFHMGAFLAAASTQYPVVPITICGARSMLRDDSWFPRKGSIDVIIGEPILIEQGNDYWQVATQLKNKARAEILYRCREPDLEQ